MSERHPHHEHADAERRGLHKDWRTWAVVVVMLGAIGMYVLTLDDSTLPDEQPAAGAQPAPGSAAR